MGGETAAGAQVNAAGAVTGFPRTSARASQPVIVGAADASEGGGLLAEGDAECERFWHLWEQRNE